MPYPNTSKSEHRIFNGAKVILFTFLCKKISLSLNHIHCIAQYTFKFSKQHSASNCLKLIKCQKSIVYINHPISVPQLCQTWSASFYEGKRFTITSTS